ncbi:MAG: prepilin-type N-terminal cleavage/methylation domain-containing protein [Moraxellaceae bacterium]|nr:prepilin-type N-terminal cleavage/methylation domain-containing protein [Moraxellaceae bacterium]
MRRNHVRGFTLIELLVVLAIVAMLLSIITPRYLEQGDKARDSVLRENLAGLRVSLDRYYADKGRYPEKLEELVALRYLRRLPIDPVTQKDSTWIPVFIEEEGGKGIYDVKSGATGVGRDGTAFSTW